MKFTDELIDDYIRGALGRAEREDFERQLKADADGRRRLEEARWVHEMLGASAPEVPSARMWKAIRAGIKPGPEPQASLWERLLDVLAGSKLRLSVVGMAAMFLAVFGWQLAQKPAPAPEISGFAEPQAPAPAPAVASAPAAAPSKAKAGQARPLEMAAAKPAAAEAEAKRFPSEVERALADQDLDGVIATMLRQRQAATVGPSSQAPGMAAPVETVSYDGAAPAKRASARTSSDEGASYRFDSAGAQAAPQPRLDANGFWNFRPAALALNRRDWATAKRELQLATQQAPEAAERAFARSSLKVLEPGDAAFDETAGLSVEAAQRWQVFVDNHVARYSGGVVARMPGLRSEGNELLLDMAFDRASFSPGTRFVKVADDASTKVQNSQGETVESTEFRAIRGADYLIRANELRLK
jgi:hypothetical protein